ncbi:hypothetical protein [Reinekea sp.]|jgi:hypothetical protein|uniref:hypothetical protein n=1 Tax=Reinekea sp. TaxID=1970455 RepID=UPI003988DD33
MNGKRVIIKTLLSASVALAGFAVAHGGSVETSAYQGNMGRMGHMGSMMGMNFNQPMFDLEQLTVDLELTNEQVAILSQLEASHIQMQVVMQSQQLEGKNSFGHMRMMSMMDENYELMGTHLNLYEQFETTLTDEQADLWNSKNEFCH